MLDALSVGLRAGGVSVTELNVGDLNVAPCSSCFCCMMDHPGECAVGDDMQEVYPLLKQADLLVLGSPVYCDNMSAQLKTLIDRCLCAKRPLTRIDEQNRVRLELVWTTAPRWVLVSTCNYPEPDNFAPLSATVRAMCANFDAQLVAEFLIPGSLALQLQPQRLAPYLELLERAGRQLADDEIVCPELQTQINTPPLTSEEYRRVVRRLEELAP